MTVLFVRTDLQTMYGMQCVSVLRSTAEFYIPGFYDSLVIAIKSKATTNVGAVTFVVHITKILYKKMHIFHAFSIYCISRSKSKGR
jgi:hypothetical protein